MKINAAYATTWPGAHTIDNNFPATATATIKPMKMHSKYDQKVAKKLSHF